jgi:drug/metabolite transporter (DMT)-like permease
VGGVAARRIAALRVMLAAYPVEAVLLGALALFAGGPIHAGAVFWGCMYGIGQAFGMWAFYAALGSGPISVVAPLAGVLNAAVPVAVGIALGERPGQALVAQLIALQSWLLSLASILISLYPAATVMLAMAVLRERVTRWQGIGMAMAMGSVAMIAAG